MILQVFAVYDSKAKAYAQPFYAPNKGLATRYFADGANDPTLQMCKHSEDFTLFHLGSWNDENGSFELLPAPQSLALAASLKQN
ncbi:MAG: nonstructural protein [Microviridae sp.]|nr:MAG: nonstructural protein [Microviridae sp.]